ncbi:hypothetical protein IJI94_00185 [Candidatus Saccharibacteria bacterium]|nr:hypothetical protein [Candidatus Saccharibacteria bacterium]
MDPEDNSDNQDEQKTKRLPTYVFGEDYEQTVNLADRPEEQKQEDDKTDTPKIEPEAEASDADKEVSEAINEGVINSELQKIELDKTEPTPIIATKKKRRSKKLILVLIIIVIVCSVICGVFFLLQGGFFTSSIFANKNLICEATSNNGELLGSGNALESKSRVEVIYKNNDFVSLTQTLEAKFENSSTAKIAMSNVRSDYTKRFKSFNISTEPFKSDYKQNDTSITITHYADTSMINSANAGVIYIDVNQNGVIIYDMNSIKKNYEDVGYACRVE